MIIKIFFIKFFNNLKKLIYKKISIFKISTILMEEEK